MFDQNTIRKILDIAKRAGDIILEYYQNYQDISIAQKEDSSPVTKADLAANDIIMEELKNLFPKIAIVSEENKEEDNLAASRNNQYFIIDPLDGTSAFIKKSDEFTVNIALIKNYKPVFGVIYLPAKDVMYFTDHNSQSRKIINYSKNINISQTIKTSKNQGSLRVICTKREPEKSEVITYLKNKNIPIKEIISISSSYKFCLIAEGLADLYPRRVSIKAWDIAAGHAIVNGAGGKMVDHLDRKELEYKLENSFNMPFFEVL